MKITSSELMQNYMKRNRKENFLCIYILNLSAYYSAWRAVTSIEIESAQTVLDLLREAAKKVHLFKWPSELFFSLVLKYLGKKLLD